MAKVPKKLKSNLVLSALDRYVWNEQEPHKRSAARKYGVAIVLTIIVTLFKFSFSNIIGSKNPFLLYFGDIIVVAGYGGTGPAILATALAALITDFFFLPAFNEPSLQPDVLVQLAMFVIESAFIIGMSRALGGAAEKVRRNGQRFRFLADASKVLSSSLDFQETMEAVSKLAVPHMATWCAIHVVDDGVITQIALAHEDKYKLKFVKKFNALELPTLSDSFGVAQVLKKKKSYLIPLVSDEILQQSISNPEKLHLAHELHMTSVMLVPLFVNAIAIGVISYVSDSQKRLYSTDDVLMAEELASRAGLAIENAFLYREAKQEIQKRRKMEKQKDEFLRIAGHELKTPVTSIKAYTQVLLYASQKRGETEPLKQLRKLDAQIDKLTHLIGDLFDATKIEAGKMVLNVDEFSFDTLVEEVVEEIQFTSTSHTIHIEGKTGRTLIADRERTSQVIINLITNAIKYSLHADKVSIKLENNVDHVQFSITDFGIGIPSSKKEKIFERFYRVSGDKPSSFPGLGLGLYISSEIVHRQGGKIWFESKEGKGTTFYFTLPIKKKKA